MFCLFDREAAVKRSLYLFFELYISYCLISINKTKYMSKKQRLSKQAQRPVRKTVQKSDNGMLEYDGTIIENFGNTNFKVQLDINEDMHVTGTISGKMRMHYITVGVGDRVHVEMSPYDLTKCRITKRLQ